MDGAPAAVFDGSWYCAIEDVDEGQLYELPLDMEQIPPGDHLIWGLYLDMSEITDRPTPADDEMYYQVSVFPSTYIYDIIVEE